MPPLNLPPRPKVGDTIGVGNDLAIVIDIDETQSQPIHYAVVDIERTARTNYHVANKLPDLAEMTAEKERQRAISLAAHRAKGKPQGVRESYLPAIPGFEFLEPLEDE